MNAHFVIFFNLRILPSVCILGLLFSSVTVFNTSQGLKKIKRKTSKRDNVMVLNYLISFVGDWLVLGGQFSSTHCHLALTV